MKYPLLVSDFDGTLLRSDLTIGEPCRRAIARYRAAGGHFVICTGRMPVSVRRAVRVLGLGDQPVPVIGFQGALVADRFGRVLHVSAIDRDSVLRVLRFAASEGLYVHIYDTERLYVERVCTINLDYCRICDITMSAVGDLAAFVAAREIAVVKILMVIDPSDRAALLEKCARLGLKDTTYFMSSESYLEFTATAAGKGNALRAVAAHLGVPIECTAAIGDQQNDITMLRAAGLGAAVANACREAKAAADVVVPTNDDDGVAYLIEHYCMGE